MTTEQKLIRTRNSIYTAKSQLSAFVNQIDLYKAFVIASKRDPALDTYLSDLYVRADTVIMRLKRLETKYRRL